MKLTERQQQIIDLRTAYTPVKVIAKQLGISDNTVRETLRICRIKIFQGQGQKRVDYFDARKSKALALIAGSSMASTELREHFPDVSERQMKRLVHHLSASGQIVQRGRGATSRWYTPENLAAEIGREQAMFVRQDLIDAAAKRELEAADKAETQRAKTRARVSRRAVRNVAAVVNTRPTVDGVSTAPAAWNGSEMIFTEKTVEIYAKTPPSRYAPEPGFARAITSDWALRRQGVEIESRFAGVY